MNDDMAKCSDVPPTQAADLHVIHPEIRELKTMIEELRQQVREANDKLDRIILNPRIVR